MANSSDTAPRNPSGATQMLADALLRSVGGACAQLRVTTANTDGAQCEVGIVATTFAEVLLSPVVMRRLRPSLQEGEPSKSELLVSATSIQQQIGALSLDSAQSLFAMTVNITVAGQQYWIESVASNEAFGQIYMYRLLLREARQQAI